MDLFVAMNRAGIILNFISFWFVAPEVLGEERMHKIVREFEGFIFYILSAFPIIGVIGVLAIVWGGIPDGSVATFLSFLANGALGEKVVAVVATIVAIIIACWLL